MIGIRELMVPGASIESRLVLPSDLVGQFAQPGATTPAWVMSRDHNDGRETDGVIRREFTVPKDAMTSVIAFGALANQSDAVRVVDKTATMNIGASSTLFDLPEFAPRSLIDGLDTTRWLSSRTQAESIEVATIDLRWNGSRALDSFTMGLDPDLAIPESVTVSSGNQVRTVLVGPDGLVSFEPIVGDSLSIVLSYPGIDLDEQPLRIGLSSLVIPALVDLYPGPIDRSAPFVAACGSGPRLRVGAAQFGYSIEATLGEVLDRSRLQLIPCEGSDLSLTRGRVMLETDLGSLPFAIDSIVIGAPPVLSTDVSLGRTLTIDSWESATRKVTIASGDTDLLVVNEIFNSGWTATLDGQELSPLEVDGWRQAFVVPPGAGGQILLSFAPERAYQSATILALLVLLSLFLLAAIPGPKWSDLAPLYEGTWPKPLVWTVGAVAAIWTTGLGAILLPIVWFVTKGRRPLLAPTALIAFGAAGATYLATKSFVDTNWFGAKGWIISILAIIALLAVIIGFVFTSDDDATPEGQRPDGC